MGRIFRLNTKVVFIIFIILDLFCVAMGMSILWGRTISMLFDSNPDLKNFGIPLILYDPKISFIGWLVLMVYRVILQLTRLIIIIAGDSLARNDLKYLKSNTKT